MVQVNNKDATGPVTGKKFLTKTCIKTGFATAKEAAEAREAYLREQPSEWRSKQKAAPAKVALLPPLTGLRTLVQ